MKSTINFISLALFILATGIGTADISTSDERQLRPYAEWVKTAPAKSLLPFARETVSSMVNGFPTDPPGDDSFPWRQQPVGVFVTVMKERKVRACVGTFIPTQSTLAKELYRQCKRLIAEDPRHKPLSPDELETLRFVISFAGSPSAIGDPTDADIWKQGLLMRWNGREAVLLPGEAKTLSWGIAELRRQVQIPNSETPSYAVFPVVILQEPPTAKKS